MMFNTQNELEKKVLNISNNVKESKNIIKTTKDNLIEVDKKYQEMMAECNERINYYKTIKDNLANSIQSNSEMIAQLEKITELD